MKILSYNKKAIVLPIGNGNLIPGLKFIFFVSMLQGRQGRRRRKLLDDLKERRVYSHLKEEALDRTMWRARYGRGFEPVVRQTTK